MARPTQASARSIPLRRPRERIRDCLRAQSPSGDPALSAADHQVTRQMRDAGRAMDIELIDGVIVGSKEDDPLAKGYYSFREAGIL